VNFTGNAKIKKITTCALALGLFLSTTLTLVCSLEAKDAQKVVSQATPWVQKSYPENKITIVGGGIIGALEAYYAHVDAQKTGKKVRVMIYERNKSITDTTTANIAPSLTPDEILSVVPRGKDFVNKLQVLFSQPGGIRVDDVKDVNKSPAATHFMEQAEIYSQDEAGYKERTQTLLEFGKMSMDLWQGIYDNADAEFKAILVASNFNPCREPRTKGISQLRDGYRVDPICNMSNALEHAHNMKRDYENIGYKNCKILSPAEVMALDPYLTDFCKSHTVADKAGVLTWRSDSVALWRPGGCLDAQVLLPRLYDYLKKAMGTYTDQSGKTQNCFQLHLNKEVQAVEFGKDGDKTIVTGLRFADGQVIRDNNCSYVFCPGEAVGTLKKFGFKEPAYAGFAGASLKFYIPVPADKIAHYANFNHCMEVHQVGVVQPFQSRVRDGKIDIAVAGTKAFYADQKPDKNEAFGKNRNLLQFNIVNEILPECMSLALGRDTKGQTLTQADLDYLEKNNIVKRWVGTRAVVYDGFPTLGAVYNHEGVEVTNARVTTHLGSGGASFGPASVTVSRGFKNQEVLKDPVMSKALNFAKSDRIADGHRAKKS